MALFLMNSCERSTQGTVVREQGDTTLIEHHVHNRWFVRLLQAGIVCGGILAPFSSCYAAPQALYVTDGDVIHGFDAVTGAPLPSFTDISLLGATGLAMGPDGDLYAGNTDPAQIFRYDPTTGAQIGAGPFVTFNGQNDGHDVQNPQGMRFGPGGSLYVADVTLSNVHIYDSLGNSQGAITSASLDQPGDVAFDSSGNLYVVNPGSANILVAKGSPPAPLADFTSPTAGGLINPTSLSFGPDGDLYVLDIGGGAPKVVRFTPSGTPDGTVLSFAGNNPFNPAYLAFGPDGNLYLSGQDLNTAAGEVLKFGTDGAPLGTFIGTGLTAPTFLVFSVPEPRSVVLLGWGALGLGLYAMSRRRLRTNRPRRTPGRIALPANRSLLERRRLRLPLRTRESRGMGA
jgi:sugar lactone lactonase YvrE